MTTKPTRPREWPNGAREKRDRAAEYAAHALCEARKYQEERAMLREETLLHASRIIDDLQNILRLLESAGAQTRP